MEKWNSGPPFISYNLMDSMISFWLPFNDSDSEELFPLSRPFSFLSPGEIADTLWPCELITCVFVSKKTFDHGLFYCDEASLNYAFCET